MDFTKGGLPCPGRGGGACPDFNLVCKFGWDDDAHGGGVAVGSRDGKEGRCVRTRIYPNNAGGLFDVGGVYAPIDDGSIHETATNGGCERVCRVVLAGERGVDVAAFVPRRHLDGGTDVVPVVAHAEEVAGVGLERCFDGDGL